MNGYAKGLFINVVGALLLFATVASSSAYPVGTTHEGCHHAPAGNDIVTTAQRAGGFDTLVAALEAAGLEATLKGAGPFTVFAPTDEAFRKLSAAHLTALLADPDTLAQVLAYHVLPGRVTAAQMSAMTEAATVQGASVAIDAGEIMRVDGASVIMSNVESSNGVIHVIDAVILPPEVEAKLLRSARDAATKPPA